MVWKSTQLRLPSWTFFSVYGFVYHRYKNSTYEKFHIKSSEKEITVLTHPVVIIGFVSFWVRPPHHVVFPFMWQTSSTLNLKTDTKEGQKTQIYK